MQLHSVPLERARYLGTVGLLAAAYFAAAKLSLSLAIPPGYATAVWPPSGIALAAVLLLGPRVWPGVWLGAALVNYTIQSSLFAAVAIGTGNTLEALAAGALVRRGLGIPRNFERGEDVFRFIVFAALSATIAATVALLPLSLGHALSWQEAFWNWWTWWQGDAAGIVVVAPLILAWSARGPAFPPPGRSLEVAVIGIALLLVCYAVFSAPDAAGNPFARAFVLIPFVVWAGFRLGQREVATVTAAISAFAVWYTVQGSGPFVTESIELSLLVLSLFVSIVAATGLVLGAVLGERGGAMQELSRRRDELEARVAERTADLERANRALQDDIAARERVEAQLLEASFAADQANRAKSEFLARMSHELRTPLNSLLILAKLLADNVDGNLTAKQLRYAQTIHGAGMDLLAIINDILDLSRIESGRLPPLSFAQVPIAELHDYVERTFRQVAQEKGLQFTIDVSPALPAAIETDPQRLQQVLRNLLANAFKFTPQGSVALRIAAEGGRAAFSVMDTGIGIPEDKREAIFEAFRQADGTASRQYGGSGLGLSISRELARLLGGEIRVASAPGQGSTFTLLLPFARTPGFP